MHSRSTVVAAIVRLVLLCGLPVAVGACDGHMVPSNLVGPTPPPVGTSQVTGYVANVTGILLQGATVTVISSSGTSTTTSGYDGRYALPAAGDVTVRAQMAGFDAQEQRVTVTGQKQVDFRLARTMASDAYRLTVTASPSCALPSDTTPRQYTATVTEDAGRLVVYLGGATLIAFGGDAGFTGTRNGNTVRFDVSGDEMGFFSFIEFLPGTRWLIYSGTATGTISGNTISATFTGKIRVAVAGEGSVAECQAADHRMEFVR